jgi:hypothetical protein
MTSVKRLRSSSGAIASAFLSAIAALSGRPLRKKTPPSVRSTSTDLGCASAACTSSVSACS